MIRLADLIGEADTMSGSEAGFLALMRANRLVQNRRKADQAAVDLEATKEFERARPRPRRPDSTDDKINEAFKRALPEDIPTHCGVCGATLHQHCFMSGSFQGCPRDLGRLSVVSPNPVRDKWSGC
jgi:hypothetical protein